jgi:hypothetical protein
MRNRHLLGIAALVAASAAGTTLAGASDTIQACVRKDSVLVIASADQCRALGEPLVWNVQGPPGPKGDPGTKLASIDDLKGLACSSGDDSGGISVNVEAGGGVTLRCSFTSRGPILRINEVMTASTISAASEFVEIVNTGLVRADLGGYKLVYRSAPAPRTRPLPPSPPGPPSIREPGTSSAGRPSGDRQTRRTTAVSPPPRAGWDSARRPESSWIRSDTEAPRLTHSSRERRRSLPGLVRASPACRTGATPTSMRSTSSSGRRRRPERSTTRDQAAASSIPASSRAIERRSSAFVSIWRTRSRVRFRRRPISSSDCGDVSPLRP